MNIKQKITRALQFFNKEFNTFDPFELCDKLKIKIRFKKYNVEAMKGYVVKIVDDNIVIYINDNLSDISKRIVCAHELGHVLLHEDAGNYFDGGDDDKEFEANLFAALLLLNQNDYDIKFENMNNYLLQKVIDELIY